MSLLINGMKMPKEGHLIIRIYASGEVCKPTKCAGLWGKVATAVPVPPHGDLIDRDALMENAQYKGTHDIVTAWDIVAAPTIIPACEEVYDKYTDTAGNLHWTGTHSGAHNQGRGGQDMRDFNTVKSDLIRNLSLSYQRIGGEIMWYEGTLDVLVEFLSMLHQKAEEEEQ